MSGSYVPLWVKSNYSFLEGASHPEEMVERAHALGLPAVAITDRDGVYGMVRAHVRAKQLGQRLLVGAQVSLGAPELAAAIEMPHAQAALDRVLLFPQTRKAYGAMTRLVSIGRQRCPKGYSVVTIRELLDAQQEMIAIAVDPGPLKALAPVLGDRLYAMATRRRADDDRQRQRIMQGMAEQAGVKLVGGAEVLYHHASRRPLQDVLSCLREGKTLQTAGTTIRGNAEHDLKPPAALYELFEDAPELVRRSLEIADRIDFSLDELRYVYPAEHVPRGRSEQDWLTELTFRGARERYPDGIPLESEQQIQRELELIHELDYGGYFLTMWEIVQFCRREQILCQGRGSAANSIVCYCLGITAIDPVRMHLLFERFISRERAEPPDIDLDIEHERREEVIQWVYRRYGRRRAAMVANFIRYRARSAVRDVGKALAIPQTALDRLSKLLGYYDHGVSPDVLRHAGLDPQAPAHAHLLELVGQIADFPRHLSIHPGGFLLGHEPVDEMVPVEPATMEDRTVIQWDKYDVEDLGLFKVDLLGLGALTHIRKSFEMLESCDNLELDMASVPAEDPSTYDMISLGDTIGVFQIESRAQMAMLPRLRPKTFYDLVIEVAIVRPGPIQGDMVHPYLRRRKGQEPVEYPHPALEAVLAKTLGVPIFQEQVMKLAIAVAGYTGGEADQLRRDMAAWRSSGRIEAHRERLISRMIQNGIAQDFAERVFSQIRGFGEYGFPESHAASFALIAYITAWLRCHHPAVFCCGLLNAQPMGFYAPATIIEDAKRHGVTVLPICAQRSSWDCTIEDSPPTRRAVRMGFRYAKGLGVREMELLEATTAARDEGGAPYRSLESFVRHTGLPRKALLILAEAGAFDAFGIDRRQALWQLRGILSKLDDTLRVDEEPAGSRQQTFARLAPGEAVLWDYRTSMHSARGHPIDGVRNELDRLGLPTARMVRAYKNGRRARYVGMVICRQRPQTASGVTFFTLEDETGFVNVVVWAQVFAEHRILAKTALLLGVSGTVQSHEGVVHLVAETLWDPKLQVREGPPSRDFH